MKMGAMKKKAAEVGADPAEVAAALGDDADDPKADLIKVITATFKANLPAAPTPKPRARPPDGSESPLSGVALWTRTALAPCERNGGEVEQKAEP